MTVNEYAVWRRDKTPHFLLDVRQPEEYATAKINPTPTPKGGPVPFDEAYAKQAFYRTVCQRETGRSFLRPLLVRMTQR